MANLYITEQGAMLRKSGNRVLVSKQDATLLEIPCHEIDTVLLFGGVHFTTPAVRTLFEHGIELALFTRRGKLLCQLTPPMPKNVLLRLAQYQHVQDAAFSLAFSKALVQAKIANSVALVRQHLHNHPAEPFAEAIAELERGSEHAAQAATIEELLGIEGTTARTYFEAFGKMLRVPLPFPGRRRRPPTDPVNALLSFGYTLLFNELASLLDGIGFDPHLGLFHRPAYGRASLAADLVEEFRAPVVDRLTLRLLNTRTFTADDFEQHASSGGVYLKRDQLRKYFLAYEHLLGTAGNQIELPSDPPQLPPADVRPAPDRPALDEHAEPPSTSFRTWFRHQARQLAGAITDGTPYVPYSL